MVKPVDTLLLGSSTARASQFDLKFLYLQVVDSEEGN